MSRALSAFAALTLGAVLGAAPVCPADVTVSGAVFRSDVSGALAGYVGGPLGSIGRGARYERITAADSLIGDIGSGGGPGFVYSRSFAEYRLDIGSPGSQGGYSVLERCG